MPNTDPRVDAYIEKKGGFARPILEHLRGLVHRAHPGIEETIKWGAPFYVLDGQLLCMMAAFKAHVSFGFWNAAAMKDAKKLLAVGQNTSMGHFGKITSMKDLPSDAQVSAYLKEAIALAEKGVKPSGDATRTRGKAVLPVPAYFKNALAKNKKAKTGFEALPPSHKREYLLWFAEAKKEETRDKRVAQALEWIAEGKSRNWKYEKR